MIIIANARISLILAIVIAIIINVIVVKSVLVIACIRIRGLIRLLLRICGRVPIGGI